MDLSLGRYCTNLGQIHFYLMIQSECKQVCEVFAEMTLLI